MNRRAAHCAKRRRAHAELRKAGVIRQEYQSSVEGPDDSKKAQKALGNWKARKPSLYLRFQIRFDKVEKG